MITLYDECIQPYQIVKESTSCPGYSQCLLFNLERRLKLSLHYCLKTHAWINNRARYALHKFDDTTRDLYVPRPNGRRGMMRPSAHPIGLKVEAGIWPLQMSMSNWPATLGTPNFSTRNSRLQPEETQPH